MPLGLRPFLILLLSLGLSGCSIFRKPAPPEPPKEQSDALIFENATLEQANESGERLWKLRTTEATYTQSGKTAKVMKPRGKLFQGEQEIYEVEAAEGEVNEDGEIVFLRQNVVVQDLRDGATIKADEAEWRPNDDRLILRGNVVGTQADLKVLAQEGIWQDSSNQVQLTGTPVVMTQAEQRLKLETEGMTWLVAEQKVLGDRPLKIQQFAEANPEQVIRTATANQGNVNLENQSMLLKDQAKLNFVEPSLDIASDALRWNPQKNTVDSEARVTVIDRDEKVTIIGDRGTANLNTEIVEFTGNVEGVSELRQSSISADRLKWFSANQDVEANGNVNYVQTQPALDVSGSSAVGNLNQEKVLMSGGDVKTIVIPLDE